MRRRVRQITAAIRTEIPLFDPKETSETRSNRAAEPMYSVNRDFTWACAEHAEREVVSCHSERGPSSFNAFHSRRLKPLQDFPFE